MSEPATADPIPLRDSEQTPTIATSMNHQSDAMYSNHNLPARSLAEDDKHNTTDKDDAATMAASEELKHTTISDKVHVSALEPSATRREPAGGEDKMQESVKDTTPDVEPTDTQDEEMKERLTSPKKKRGRDTYDESKELQGDNIDETGSSADGSAVNGSRSEREGPEKKRHRDTSEDPTKVAEKAVEVKVSGFYFRVSKALTAANHHPRSRSQPSTPKRRIRRHLPIPKHLRTLLYPHQNRRLAAVSMINHKRPPQPSPARVLALSLHQPRRHLALLVHPNQVSLVETRLHLVLVRLLVQNQRVRHLQSLQVALEVCPEISQPRGLDLVARLHLDLEPLEAAVCLDRL